jgi:hypothetical protein
MIETAEEFIRLRQSDNMEEQRRAALDTADISVWMDVIKSYPDFKFWVIHNKTIQIEILEILCTDKDPNVRSHVARKRKINDTIFNLLCVDPDENVRHSLMWNTKLTLEKIKTIKVDDSDWLKEQLANKIKNASK